MIVIERRRFLRKSAALAAACAWPLGNSHAVAEEKFDLVIRGGEVIDPSQNLRAMRDVAIRHAQIAAVEPKIPDAQIGRAHV